MLDRGRADTLPHLFALARLVGGEDLLAYRDSLSTIWKAGHRTNGREAAITFHPEAADCSCSVADIKKFTVSANAQINRSVDLASSHRVKQAQHTIRRDAEAPDGPTSGVRRVGVAAIFGGRQPAWR